MQPITFQGGQAMPAKWGTPFTKGNIPWHKGKKLPYKARPSMKGRIPWNKGKSGLQKAWNKGLEINNSKIFWSRVNKTETCWNWIGDTRGNYGVFPIGGKKWSAHQFSFFLTTGIKSTLKNPLDHLCRNTLCVNPEHLEIVTSQVNTQRGSTTKLSPNNISVIRQLYETGLHQPYIGSLFGVGQWQVSRIVNYKSWSNITTL